jgi:hypothetical protein
MSSSPFLRKRIRALVVISFCLTVIALASLCAVSQRATIQFNHATVHPASTGFLPPARTSAKTTNINRGLASASPFNYPNKSVIVSGDTTISPDVTANVTGLNASTGADFQGTLLADPVTGIVNVTNAHPAGSYLVKVTAFNPSSSTTFTLTVLNGTACSTYTAFANASAVGTGSQPESVAIGDFNNNGKQDLAIANFVSNTVSIRLGDGTGAFNSASQPEVTVGGEPSSIAVGDFNNDGKLDFLTANFDSHNVSIRLGDGSGGFTSPSMPEISVSNFVAIAVGDFNNDGKLDFATAGSTISIRLGDGTGGFSAPVTSEVAAGNQPQSIAIADFNNDGKLDFVAANAVGNNVSVRLGDGSGGFSSPSSPEIAVGTNPISLAVGDFNGDGKLDFATANGVDNDVSIRLGDGTGRFSSAPTPEVTVSNTPRSIALGDFNNDGKQDFVTVNSGSNTLSIRLGNGSGGFSSPTTPEIEAGNNGFSVVIGDFNVDGKQDLAVGGFSTPSVSIHLADCAPSISAVGVSRSAGGTSSNSIIANVSDTEDAANTLVVTVNGSSSIDGPIKISNLGVSAGGQVTADVEAPSCAAQTANFTLSVTDRGGLSSTAMLTVTVTPNTPPTLSYSTPPSVPYGGSLTIDLSTGPTDNGSVSTIAVLDPGTYGGTISVNSAGVVSISNAQPAGTHTIKISATDNCGETTVASFALTVNCPSVVTNSSDKGLGALRDVINQACAGSTITFDMRAGHVTTPITLTSGELVINKSLMIQGPGANLLTISGNIASRVFNISTGNSVQIRDLTIANGKVTGSNRGGNVLNSGTLSLTNCNIYGGTANAAGGLYNMGLSMTLTNCNVGGTGSGQANSAPNFGGVGSDSGTLTIDGGSISGNSATSTAGGIAITGGTANIKNARITDNSSLRGGGVYVSGFFHSATANIANCLIANNKGGEGGGIYIEGLSSATVVNTTISGNSSGATGALVGPGIDIEGGNLSLTNVTITNNSTTGFASGGGISARGSSIITLTNTIVIGNSTGSGPSDISGQSGTINSSSSFNLIGIGGLTNGVNNNQVGVTDARLAPLANNGGPTMTHALLPGSTALDAGSNTNAGNAGLTNDQRGAGFARVVDGPDADSTDTVDIGAFEAQVSVEDIPDKTTNEDTQLQFIFNLGGVANITSVTATSSNTTLVPNNAANIALSGSGSTRTLTINPVANLFDTSTITVTVTGNNDQSMTDTFVLTVNSVNDAPSFTKGAGQTVNNNAGLFTVPNWATAMSAGPANESGQTLTFQVTGNTNASLFAGPISIDSSTGNLAFTPTANAGGTATITIVLRDNGGTENGGVDTSPPQSFTITVVPAGGVVSFESTTSNTTENSGSTSVNVIRSGDTSRAISDNYATNGDSGLPCSTANGIASPKCDFTPALGTLSFAAGESAKTVTILISQDSFVEGPETITLTLSIPTNFAALGTPATKSVTIADDVTEPPTNVIDEANMFVRMHYHDFLNREADQSGLDFWTNQITSCGSDAACIEVRRINVSAAFFLSIEFQQTGYLVERMYKTAYADAIGISSLNGSHQIFVPVVRANEFLADAQRIGRGVVVLQPGWEQALENSKQAYALEFVQTSRFIAALPTTMTPKQFVDKLNQNVGNVLSLSERTTAINLFGISADTTNVGVRAQAVRQVAEDADLNSAEFNRAFVLMQYFGYLRRNPNDAPDSDYTGYEFWLTKLNQFNGNFVNAEMTKAFITSGEYRQRFGP